MNIKLSWKGRFVSSELYFVTHAFVILIKMNALCDYIFVTECNKHLIPLQRVRWWLSAATGCTSWSVGPASASKGPGTEKCSPPTGPTARAGASTRRKGSGAAPAPSTGPAPCAAWAGRPEPWTRPVTRRTPTATTWKTCACRVSSFHNSSPFRNVYNLKLISARD